MVYRRGIMTLEGDLCYPGNAIIQLGRLSTTDEELFVCGIFVADGLDLLEQIDLKCSNAGMVQW